MNNRSLTHVGDAVLLRNLANLILQERISLAYMLALIGEIDARRLYASSGYSSMHAFCVNKLQLSDDAAYKRIQAARAARRFPVLFHALAEGRLHLTAVCLLAPHLTIENLHELVAAATHRRQPEIEAMLARRLSLPPSSTRDRPIVRAIPPVTPLPTPQLAVPQVDCLTGDTPSDSRAVSEGMGEGAGEKSGADGDSDNHPPPPPVPNSRDPAQPNERYLIKLTVSRDVHDKLRYAQALLSHAVPSGNLASVLDRALDALIEDLERRKFGVARLLRPHPT